LLCFTAFCGAGDAARADDGCPAPGEAEFVVAQADGWRTLVTQEGERLIPAGIADFAVLGASSTEKPAEKHEAITQALADAFRRHAGKSLGIVYLSDRPDRRNRRPVLLFADGALVQEDLIAQGLAIAYSPGGDLPCASRLLNAEDEARKQGRGFWTPDSHWIALPRPEHFAGRLDHFVILQARVVSVGTRERRTYLNFGGLWANDVTVEIPAARREAFGGVEALEALEGRRLRVRGYAVEKSGPMIEVRQPWQIEVLTNALQ